MKSKTKKIKKASESVQAYFNQFDLSPASLLIVFGINALIIVLYMLSSPRPYDDDNIGRYFMAQSALDKPEFFINMWGRPLAIIFFLLPAQFGYWFSASATAALTLGTCFFIYKAARSANFPNAWLSVIFLFFQPLFLITSFSLCTEPLAAFLLAMGLYFYYKGSWNASALSLSFMSLARTELVMLLPVFAAVFLFRKKWMPFLLLGAGLLIFQITGMAMTGDSLFLLTAAKSAGHGLYQNGPFAHYFERFIFITGPVMFIFLLFQLVSDARMKRVTVLNISFILIFSAHVYFYWKGNVASIGFLRHFVGIAPVMALLALEGFNRWFHDAPSGETEKKNNILDTAVLACCSAIILFFYSFELIGDYFVSDEKEYLKFAVGLVIVLLFVLNKYFHFTGRTWKLIMMFFVVIAVSGYTLAKQKPLKLAPEHQAVKNFQNYYESQLKDSVSAMMVVHPWFFFFDDYNYYLNSQPTRKYIDMRLEKLPELPVGGLIAWDSHYSWRLSSNVALDTLRLDNRYQYTQQFVSNDRKFAIYLFKKIAE